MKFPKGFYLSLEASRPDVMFWLDSVDRGSSIYDIQSESLWTNENGDLVGRDSKSQCRAHLHPSAFEVSVDTVLAYMSQFKSHRGRDPVNVLVTRICDFRVEKRVEAHILGHAILMS